MDIPIDIHAHKLLEWLINHRICTSDWQANIQNIRTKINDALGDMPEHEAIVELLNGNYLNYFHCCKIVEILKETEKDTKNIFGRYGSRRMKDWQQVVSLYEKNNVYLAEAVQILNNNIQYVVPSIKKQIAKCKQMQEECDKRDSDSIRRANELKEQYHVECRHLGIEGDELKREIVGLVRDLPTVFSGVCKSLQDIVPARDYYAAFLDFTHETHGQKCTPFLQYLIEKGNVTTYEYKYGEPPLRVEETADFDLAEDTSETVAAVEDTIDFGSYSLEAAADLEVDNDASGEIDWGNELVEETWKGDIELTDESAMINVVVEDSGMEGGVASGEEALTVLENARTRNLFLNDLAELEGFLEQRLEELKGDEDILTFTQFQDAPNALQLQSYETVSDMYSKVQKLMAQMSTDRMQHLYLIKESPRYVDRLVEKLKSFLKLAEKTLTLRHTIAKQKAAAAEDARKAVPELQSVIKKSQELELLVINDISKRQKNRSVNIMGGASYLDYY